MTRVTVDKEEGEGVGERRTGVGQAGLGGFVLEIGG